jgi:hypothetical protein
MISRGQTPRLLLRLRKGLKRLDLGNRGKPQTVTPDRAWHEMLARLDAEETQRRLDAMANALNEGARR